MNKVSAIERFLKNWVEPKNNELDVILSKFYEKDKTTIIAGFIESLETICRKTVEMQYDQGTEDICYISYSTLAIDFLNKGPLYLIEVFGDNWFFSESLCESAYEPKWLTSQLFEFYDHAMDEHMKYGGVIHPTEVEKTFLTVVDIQTKRFAKFLKENVKLEDIEAISAIGQMKKGRLLITMGSYRGLFDEIYERKPLELRLR